MTSRHRQAIVLASVAALAVVVGGIYLAFFSAGHGTEQPPRLSQAANETPGVSGGEAADLASSGLRLCNRTASRVGIAIGYNKDGQWTTEGWWNVDAGMCGALVEGPLVSRVYYIYALDYDEGGVWGGGAAMCTSDKEFTIQGIEDCVARGYERTGFFEVDTGEQRSWTVQLTEPVAQGTGGR